MSDYYHKLAEQVQQRFGDTLKSCKVSHGELTIEMAPEQLLDTARALRDEEAFAFEQMIDIAGLDYLEYGMGSWQGPRFAVVYHLLSVKHNHRIRMRVFIDGEFPTLPSVVSIWSSANWYEREAFDLYGMVFEGHPDLRRILTDYGFIGHPFRKDFPISGYVEMRFDPEKQRVVYQPVSIEPRDQIPRVIRDDHRYVGEGVESEGE